LQAKGNSVIDFIWVQREDLKLVRQFETVSDEEFRWSDHLLVAMVMVTFGCSIPSNTSELAPGTEGRRQLRWNAKAKGETGHWRKLQDTGKLLMKQWAMKESSLVSPSFSDVEELWTQWKADLTRTVEIGLGYAPLLKKRMNHDPYLAKLIEVRNGLRKGGTFLRQATGRWYWYKVS